MQSLISPGIYQHYKGNPYQVTGTAIHSETEEVLVVYFPLYGDESTRTLWVRPLTMFTEHVDTDAGRVPRFRLMEVTGE